jgi:uncharacterized protein (TIRG00374 family)
VKRILQITFVAALTIFFLALFLWNADLKKVGAIMRSTNVFWLVVAFVVNFSALILRTIRWQTILDTENPPPFYPTFFANTVGYMLSTVLPVRAGDVARPALLARRTKLRFAGALGTVLTERVLDLFCILGLFVYFALRHWNDFSGHRSFFIVRAGAIGGGVTLVGLVVFIVCLYLYQSFVRRMHEFLGRILPLRFRDSWMHFFDAFVDTLSIAHNRPTLVKVLACTAGVWLCLTSQFYFTVLALHRPLPFDSSFFVTGITTLGLAIPTPGGVGGFHKACQLVLTHFYDFDVDTSVAVAILFHIVGTIPVIVIGLLLVVHEGLRWRDVTEATHEPAEE